MATLDKHPGSLADLIVRRTLQPLDYDTIQKSVQNTNKGSILQEDTLFGGIASDLSAWVMEHCFEYLDAPVKRIGSIETPIPFMNQLEEQYLPKQRFEKELLLLLQY